MTHVRRAAVGASLAFLLISAPLAGAGLGPNAALAQAPAREAPAGLVPAGPGTGAQVPRSREEIQLSFAPLVRKVAPAVVNIFTRKVEFERRRSLLFDDPFFRRFFGQEFRGKGPLRKRVRTALGSGVIVAPDGVIVTNVHVIKGAEEIRVVLADRREFDAEVLLIDPRTDLAVLRIDPKGESLPYLRLRNSDTLEVGDLVLAIGNPFGVGQTVTSGIVSALARTTVGVTDYRFFIQTDAAINPGNSGGALVTLDGRLAGVNTAIFSKSGGSIGIGFAVPANMVRAVLAGVAKGRVERPWFGASSQPVTAEIALSLGLKRPRGVLIDEVLPGGPAARAGLKRGDVVISVNGQAVHDPEALRFRFATLGVGGSARLSVLRDGKRRTVPIPLESPPETPPRHITTLSGNNPLNGITVANLSPALADELSLPYKLRGVIILRLKPGSFGARAGLRPRDIVREVNGTKTGSVASLVRALAGADGADRWRVGLERGGRRVTLAIGG